MDSLEREVEAMPDLAPEELVPSALALAERFLDASAASYYVLEEGRLRLDQRVGDVEPLRIVGLDSGGPLAQAARERCPQIARTREEHEREGIWLAAPVQRPDGSCRGAIAIHSLPFARLTPMAPALLDKLASALGAALARHEVERGQHLLSSWSHGKPTVELRLLPEAG
jgi:hypothetical protein